MGEADWRAFTEGGLASRLIADGLLGKLFGEVSETHSLSLPQFQCGTGVVHFGTGKRISRR